MKIFLKGVSSLILVVILVACGDDKDGKNKLGENDISVSTEILNLVNQHRATLDLNSLEYSEEAEREAIIHTENMASGKVELGHEGADDRSQLLFDETGATGFGENVALGQGTAAAVMDAWLTSPTHKANIEGDYTHLGVGVIADKDGVPYYTQIFLKID